MMNFVVALLLLLLAAAGFVAASSVGRIVRPTLLATTSARS